MATRPIGFNQTRSPYMDGSGGGPPPDLNYGMQFRDFGSYGLRQYSGWIREEFLTALVGREAARVFREMTDNSAIVGSMLFAIQQAMRSVEFRVHAPGDSDKSTAEVKFVESLMTDMTHTWPDFIAEALSMLPYGYCVNEIVYKRRLGQTPLGRAQTFDPRTRKFAPPPSPEDEQPSSQFDDGRIGWKRLPIRGQDTVLKWFFDVNGQVTGVTQQPWVGELIDIPIEKFLLFRPTAHKNNPEGKSVLRNAYRSYWFVKRLEELEAILFERMSGFPVMSVPNSLLEQAGSNPAAAATLAAYKNLVTNVRINEQMGALIPSDTYMDAEGKPSTVRMYDFQLLTPQHGSRSVSANDTIERHKLDMLMTLLCDFVKLGHEVRGTNNLAITKVDMFYAAIEGWLTSISDVLNRYGLPRIWKLNALPAATMPNFKPDMPERIDLDGLGGFIANLAKAGMPLFPDEELQAQIRGAAGLPEATSPEATAAIAAAAAGGDDGGGDAIKRMIGAAVAKQIRMTRPAAEVSSKREVRTAKRSEGDSPPPFPAGVSAAQLEKCGWGTRGSGTHTSSGRRKPGVTDQMVADASARAREQRAGGAGTIGGGGSIAPPAQTAPVPAVAVSHTGATSPQFRAEVDEHLSRLSPQVRQALADAKVEFVTARNSVVEAMPHLAGVQPRGWPAGRTWEHVSGIHSSTATTSKVVVSEFHKNVDFGVMVPSMRGGRVALHEAGHAYDHAKGWISEGKRFSEAHAKDVAALSANARGMHGYFLQSGAAGKHETFAELFNQAHGGHTWNLHHDFPHSYAVVKDTIGTPGAARPAVSARPGTSQPTPAGRSGGGSHAEHIAAFERAPSFEHFQRELTARTAGMSKAELDALSSQYAHTVAGSIKTKAQAIEHISRAYVRNRRFDSKIE